VNFDIDAVLADMLSAMEDSVDSDWRDVRDHAKQVLQNEKEALANLAEQRLRGDITEDELRSELEDERDTVEAEMKAVQVMTKAMAQQAADAAMEVLFKAIRAAL
jgi:predicted phage gp36 major capsid-like protein